MLETPHAAVGAALGRWIRPPWLAMLLAYLSHWLLDAIPHYEAPSYARMREMLDRAYLVQFAIDVPLLALLVLWVWRVGGRWRWAMIACAVAAIGPDLIGRAWQMLPRSSFERILWAIDRPHRWFHHVAWPDQWVLGTLSQVAAIALGVWVISLGTKNQKRGNKETRK